MKAVNSEIRTVGEDMTETADLTIGQRFADAVASTVGSWTFILIQSFILAVWIVLNGTGYLGWDVYPFILLNLGLSFQAAYTAPFILMSQKRQASIDRATLEADLEANVEELAKLDRIEIRLSEHIDCHIDEMSVKLSALIAELHNNNSIKTCVCGKRNDRLQDD